MSTVKLLCFCSATKSVFKKTLHSRPLNTLQFIRMASSFVKDKAYVNGQWVSAKSGATFNGKFQIDLYVLSS